MLTLERNHPFGLPARACHDIPPPPGGAPISILRSKCSVHFLQHLNIATGVVHRDLKLVDYRNSIVATWNATDQEVSQVAEYDPNGVVTLYDKQETPICNDGNCPNVNNLPFGFTSALRSPVTGLIHMRARWYSPQLGQFISPDPLGYIDSYNLYSYALFDPINNWDPYGLSGGGFTNKVIIYSKFGFNAFKLSLQISHEVTYGPSPLPAIKQAYKDDGVRGGLNYYNPFYNALIGTEKAKHAYAEGRYRDAFGNIVQAVSGVLGTASMATNAAAVGSARMKTAGPDDKTISTCPGGKCRAEENSRNAITDSHQQQTTGSGPTVHGELRYNNADKIQSQMTKRGWTEQQIREALTTEGLPAQGKNGPATRYVHPKTGQSVILDNATNETFHVGGPGYLYE